MSYGNVYILDIDVFNAIIETIEYLLGINHLIRGPTDAIIE